MSTFKILITSQKGGVGKSTVSANLAAYLKRQGESVTLIDFDTHGSSSTWLTRAPSMGIVVQHLVLPLDQGGNRPILDARLHLRRAATSSDVVICDLTWTDSIAGELMFEYDLVIVPTSVSEIELAATAGFLNRHRWAPPVIEGQSAREMFERGYLMDLQDNCGKSFIEFGKAVCAAREMRRSTLSMRQNMAPKIGTPPRAATAIRAAATGTAVRSNILGPSTTLSNQYSVLGRHRIQKVRDNEMPSSTRASAPSGGGGFSSIGIPQFLKRMSLGSGSKS